MDKQKIKVIAIDPGVTTGYCYAQVEPKKKMQYHPFQALDDVESFWNRLEEFDPDYIVMEDFEYRNKSRHGLNLFPVQLIGVAHLYESKRQASGSSVAIYMQKASQGKSYYKDSMLKAHGLYTRGIPHGMDASRHLLQWITFGAGYQFNSATAKIEDFAKSIPAWLPDLFG